MLRHDRRPLMCAHLRVRRRACVTTRTPHEPRSEKDECTTMPSIDPSASHVGHVRMQTPDTHDTNSLRHRRLAPPGAWIRDGSRRLAARKTRGTAARSSRRYRRALCPSLDSHASLPASWILPHSMPCHASSTSCTLTNPWPSRRHQSCLAPCHRPTMTHAMPCPCQDTRRPAELKTPA